MLLLNIVLHVLRLRSDFLHYFLLVRNSSLFLLNESVLDSLKLGSDGIEVVVMVLNSILSLLVDPPLALVHSGVVLSPFLSEDLALFVHLPLEVVAQVLELFLKLLLELVDDVVDVIHTFDRVFFVLLDLGVGVVELLLHLPFVLDTSVLEHLEGRTHVLHLRLQLGQVLILSFGFFNHF